MDQLDINLIKIFKLPEQTTKEKNYTIIGVIDTSGSMSSTFEFIKQQWNYLISKYESAYLITFSTKSSLQPNKYIDGVLTNYGGASTNIEAGISQLLDLLAKLKNQFISILFISDGQDDNFPTIMQRLNNLFSTKKQTFDAKIQFFSLGIGSRFPTFLSLKLKEYLQNISDIIPAVYYIDLQLNQSIATQFEQNFEAIAKHLNPPIKFLLEKPIKINPWDSLGQSEVFAGQWIVTTDNLKQLSFKNEQGEIRVCSQITSFGFEEITEILKQWVQLIQLLQLKQEAHQQAKFALLCIQHLIKSISNQKQTQKKSFASRLSERIQNQFQNEINSLCKELKKICDREQIASLTEEEAAKRLAIGTKVGKYHSNALKFCGLSVKEFQSIREEFIKILEVSQINFLKSSQEQSVISMQNFKEVLCEQDLKVGLAQCPNQYEFIQTFPLIGLGLRIRRFHGSLVSPWLLEVTEIARHHKIIDSLAIYAQQDNEIRLASGNGDEEIINAILPIFSEEDSDLENIIRSRLFDLLMTFSVMQNADTCYETAHSALCANVLIFLVQNKAPSEWREDILNKIAFTYHMKYKPNETFADEIKCIIETPELCAVIEHPNIQSKCQDPCKFFLILFGMIRSGMKVNIQEVVERLIMEIIARSFHQSDLRLNDFVQFENQMNFLMSDKEIQQRLQDYQKIESMQQLYSVKEALKFAEEVIALESIEFGQFQFKTEQLKKIFKYKYHYEGLFRIYEFFIQKPLTIELLTCLIYHATLNKNSYERNKIPIIKDYQLVIKKIIVIASTHLRDSKIQKQYLLKGITQSFLQYMESIHNEFKIIKYETLKQECEKNNLNIQIFDYNHKAMILRNACIHNQCPFYLKPRIDFKLHLLSFQQYKIQFYELIRELVNFESKSIHQLFAEGKKAQINREIFPDIKIQKAIRKKVNQKKDSLLYISQVLGVYQNQLD